METKTIFSKFRLHYIDILKGIGIIFVIIGHMSTYFPASLRIYLYSFHMPLFFFISGFVYKKEYEQMSYKKYISKRASELVWPYFTLSIINFIWFICINRSSKSAIQYLIAFLYSNYIFDTNLIGAVWFLLCLFIVEILYFIISKNKSNKFKNILISVFL